MASSRDPVFHAGIADCLPDTDPLAQTSICCVNCGEMVHAFNNETMKEWFETGKGAWCWDCFIPAWDIDDDGWGLL